MICQIESVWAVGEFSKTQAKGAKETKKTKGFKEGKGNKGGMKGKTMRMRQRLKLGKF